MNRRRFIVVLGAVALGASACNSSSGAIEVSGKVTLDGNPLAEGDITFIPEDPKKGAEGGKIKGGEYKMKAKPGKNRVEILATREVPGKKGPMGEQLIEPAVAEEFNTKSKLTAEVSSSNKTFDFAVKSPPAK